jgi:hypothetical protein
VSTDPDNRGGGVPGSQNFSACAHGLNLIQWTLTLADFFKPISFVHFSISLFRSRKYERKLALLGPYEELL